MDTTLPDDIIIRLLGFLDFRCAYQAARTCKRVFELLHRAAPEVAGGWQRVPDLVHGESPLMRVAFLYAQRRLSLCAQGKLLLNVRGILKPSFDALQVSVAELFPEILNEFQGHALVLDDMRRVWSMGNLWTDDLKLESGLPSAACSVTASSGSSAVVLSNGELWAWGRNTQQKLGLETAAAFVPVPARVRLQKPVSQVAIGTAHMLVVTRDGDAYGAGSNASGQLGLGRGHGLPHPTLTLVHSSSSQRVLKAAAGALSSLLLLASGQLRGCGQALSGELGLFQNNNNNMCYTFVPVFQRLAPFLDVHASFLSTALITRRGELYASENNHALTLVPSPERVVSCHATTRAGVMFVTASGRALQFRGALTLLEAQAEQVSGSDHIFACIRRDVGVGVHRKVQVHS